MCSYLLTCCAASEDGIILFVFVLFCFDLAWPSFIAPNHVHILLGSTGFYGYYLSPAKTWVVYLLCVRTLMKGAASSVSFLALTVLQ